MNNGIFLPRLTSVENAKYPYQLNKDELIKIIENQGKYYDFLLEKINVNGKEKYKLVQLLEFKIPYYVGPLNTNTSIKGISNPNAWLEKTDKYVKVTPFNFDDVINKVATAEKFIMRMVSSCTYLIKENAMPANSILYSKFKVLNELKQITVNGQKLRLHLLQRIYNELFLKSDTAITEKIFLEYLKSTNEYSMFTFLDVDGYSGNKRFANNMTSYIDFFGHNGIFDNTDYDIDSAERIINWVTIFEDKDILEKKIRTEFPKLTEEQIRKILQKKYSGWGRLSKKLLTDISYKDKVTGVPKTIMDLLWETDDNFMQLMFNKEYGFQDKINDINMCENDKKISYSLVEDLVTSPANKRGIYQSLKVVDEIINYMGYNPTHIVLEMARGEDKKQRTIDRKSYLKHIYEKCKNDIDNYLLKELDSFDKIDTEKLFLYFIQFGRSMYSQVPLDINNLNQYEVDHIIPRSLIKDDSIENKALVLKEENQSKSSSFVLPAEFRTSQMISWWRHLKELNLISEKKLKNLCRNYYTDNDIVGFINRQLVETRQISKHVSNILNNIYQNTKVISLHADLTSNYRTKFELFKFRDLNDFHHAHDAYLACVLGLYQKYYLKQTTDFEKLKEINQKMYYNRNYDEMRYGYVINSLDNNVSLFDKNTGEILFDVNNFNKTIENTIYKNDIIISHKTEIKTGDFYKKTIYKKDDKRARFNLKSNLSTSLYGGYTETHFTYMMLLEYQKNDVKTRSLIGIPILLESNKNKIALIDKYIKTNLNIDDYKILKDKLPFSLLINYQGQDCLITGCGIASAELSNETEFILPKELQKKYKYLLNYIFNKKYPKQAKYSKNLPEMTKDEFIVYCHTDFDILINELFDYVIDIMKIRYPLYKSVVEKLNNVQKSLEFYQLPLESSDEKQMSKVIVMKELFNMLKCNSTNAKLSKLNKLSSLMIA